MKHHTGDLYDTDKVLEDAVESTALACPQIATHLRQTATQEDELMELEDEQGFISVQSLIPLFKSVGAKLLRRNYLVIYVYDS